MKNAFSLYMTTSYINSRDINHVVIYICSNESQFSLKTKFLDSRYKINSFSQREKLFILSFQMNHDSTLKN